MSATTTTIAIPAEGARTLAARLAPVLRLADAAVDIVAPLFGRRRGGERWVLAESGGAIEIHRIARGIPERVAASLAELDAASPVLTGLRNATDIELRLDPDKTVTHRLTLPADARGYLDAIVAHRLDRLTPWQPASVAYATRIVDDRPAEGAIEIELVATSRDVLAESLAPLVALSIAPTAIGVAGGPLAEPLGIDLLRGQGDRSGLARRRALRTILLAMLPLSILAFAASAVTLSGAEARLDGAARGLDAARARIAANAGGGSESDAARALIEDKRLDGARFQLIADLAGAIPIDAFLSDLEVAEETVRLRGSSLNAPALVPILENLPALENVRFEAPVAREADGRDRFDIVATRVAAEPAQ